MNKPKEYSTSVRSDETDDLPTEARFAIDEATAREIVRLAALVTANGLHKLEKFDYRTSWLKTSDGENLEEVSSDADALNVSDTSFWFSAYIKHTDTEILTARLTISELMTHFSLIAETGNTVAVTEAGKPNLVSQRDKAFQFMGQVADLSIWSFDMDDGSQYEECEEPSEGFLDSHCCLMNLIEQARGIREGKL